MKIGINFLSFRSYQGTETFAKHLMLELLSSAPEMEYIVYTTPYIPEEMQIAVKGAKVVYSHLNPGHNLIMGIYQQLVLPLKLLKKGIDIFYSPFPSIPVLLLSMDKVLTIHDCAYDRFPEFRSNISRLYLKLMYYTAKYTCKVIITVSQFSKKELVTLYKINPEKIKVVYPGVPELPDVNETFIENTKRLFNIDTGYFLYIGNTRPRKNIEGLLKAFHIFTRSHNNIKLVLAGKLDESFIDITKIITTLNLKDMVIRTDFVTEKQKAALYKGAIGLVFPSYYEGFGLPVLEAQSLGVPVLTSNTSSLPEISGNGAILVDPYNIQHIADGMKALLDKPFREKLIEHGYKNIKRFSWKTSALMLAQIFKNLL